MISSAHAQRLGDMAGLRARYHTRTIFCDYFPDIKPSQYATSMILGLQTLLVPPSVSAKPPFGVFGGGMQSLDAIADGPLKLESAHGLIGDWMI